MLPVCYVSINTSHVQYLFKSQIFSGIHEVCTSVELVSSFVYTVWVSIMTILHFLIPVGYRNLKIFLFSLYHVGLYTMQELSYLGKSTLVSIWFSNGMTQIRTQVYKDSLTLTYPPNINI